MGFYAESQDSVIIDTPDTNWSELYYSEAQKKWSFKTSDGVVRTLATGVTLEEVQDILAQSLQNSSSISWTYDDNADTLTANIATSVLNSINSALQPNANISTLTNDEGYNTPSQLDTRDGNNRNRANHSGTQLASTISNFASSVRSTILTGISFASSSVVSASDSVLSALGKLQAQVTILNGRVFGTQAQDFLDVNQVNFSGALSQLKTFTTQNNPVGRYRIAANIQFEPSSPSQNDFFELRVNGTRIGLAFQAEPKDSGADIRDIRELRGYFNAITTGSFDIEIWGGNQSGTTELNGVNVEVWRQS